MAGIGHHHLIGLVLPQIGELLQQLVGGLEVDGQRRIGIRELLAGQQHMAIDLVLRLLKMHVAGGADGLPQLLPQFLLRLHVAVSQHEEIVADGLYLQIVVEGGNALELRPILVIRHRPEQLARLAG